MKPAFLTPWAASISLSALTAFVCNIPCLLLLGMITDFAHAFDVPILQLFVTQLSGYSFFMTVIVVSPAIAASAIHPPATGCMGRPGVWILEAVMVQGLFLACGVILFMRVIHDDSLYAFGIVLFALPLLLCANALRVWSLGRGEIARVFIRAILSVIILLLLYVTLFKLKLDPNGILHIALPLLTNTALLTLIAGIVGDLYYRKALMRLSPAGVANVSTDPSH